MIKDLQREETSFLVRGVGANIFYACLVLEQFNNWLCCGLDDIIYPSLCVFIIDQNEGLGTKVDLNRLKRTQRSLKRN